MKAERPDEADWDDGKEDGGVQIVYLGVSFE